MLVLQINIQKCGMLNIEILNYHYHTHKKKRKKEKTEQK